MIIYTLLLQIVLPLGLLALFAFTPAKSLVAYILQIFSTGLYLVVMSLVAL